MLGQDRQELPSTPIITPTIAGPGSPPLMPQPGVPLSVAVQSFSRGQNPAPPANRSGLRWLDVARPAREAVADRGTGKLRAAATTWQSVRSGLSSIAGEVVDSDPLRRRQQRHHRR